jgi:hypothetical protein
VLYWQWHGHSNLIGYLCANKTMFNADALEVMQHASDWQRKHTHTHSHTQGRT